MDKLFSSRNIDVTLSRLALFIVYFWFGALKVTGASPADDLVLALMDKTMPFMEPALFLMLFGLFEMFIGILFLVPRLEKIALSLLSLHVISIVLPLLLLPAMTWQSFMIPTMEGQYIIKNILIVAAAVNIAQNRRRQS